MVFIIQVTFSGEKTIEWVFIIQVTFSGEKIIGSGFMQFKLPLEERKRLDVDFYNYRYLHNLRLYYRMFVFSCLTLSFPSHIQCLQ